MRRRQDNAIISAMPYNLVIMDVHPEFPRPRSGASRSGGDAAMTQGGVGIMAAIAISMSGMGARRRFGEHRSPCPENHFIDLLGGLAFLASGIVALDRRRPGNAIGLLLVAFGFIWYFRNLGRPLAYLASLTSMPSAATLARRCCWCRSRSRTRQGRLRSAFDRFHHGVRAACAGGRALSLALLRDRTATDAETAIVAARASADLGRAIAEIRELARGIHPAVLTEDGLSAAVEFARGPLACARHGPDGIRLPAT